MSSKYYNIVRLDFTVEKGRVNIPKIAESILPKRFKTSIAAQVAAEAMNMDFIVRKEK
jgi:hypothetical protein